MLLLDSRRDGLPARAEELIAGNLARAGIEVDLDAVSDPGVLVRVLDEHQEALDRYDAVVAIAPVRALWCGRSRAIARVLERIRSTRIPTLLVEHPAGGAEHDQVGGTAPRGAHVDTLRLPTGSGSSTTAAQIGTALGVLLTRLETRPAAVSQLRADIGPVAIGRLDRIAGLARDHFGVAAAEVNLLRGDCVVTIASTGALLRTTPADDSLCVLAMRTAGLTVIADTWLDQEACRRPPTQDPDAVRYYAACPIRSGTGQPIGVLCLWDLSPHDPAEPDPGFLHDLALLSEGELIAA